MQVTILDFNSMLFSRILQTLFRRIVGRFPPSNSALQPRRWKLFIVTAAKTWNPAHLCIMSILCLLGNQKQIMSSSGSSYYYFIIISLVGLSRLGTAAISDLLYKPQMIDEGDCGAIGGMKIGRGNRSTRRKPAPAPLCLPQIPHDQTRARTRAAAVGSQRLTAWAMARPSGSTYLGLSEPFPSRQTDEHMMVERETDP
jgi:hypothetical protein